VDGELKRTCQVSCSEATGKDITTVEGLPTKVAEALKTAWLELDVAQCGYCQTGMIMAAADLLKNNGNPTDEEINDAMNKNVCRCGTYGRIRKAIHLAATRL
ncbi:2Fe-2S iron-sulfur cluster-binding protein, partial [Burkholderiaceae bacterium]|nr:2Fe-2S iron-sulfur cluster-binding protein [Burkholderiaceae bacterium]